MLMLKKFIGESAFKLAGWKYHVEPNVLEDKQVIIGFEHTSMMDAVLSLAIFQIYDMKIHTLIKKELCTRQISQNPYPIRILPS